VKYVLRFLTDSSGAAAVGAVIASGS